MNSRTTLALAVLGATLLIAMGALHASGYAFVHGRILESDLPTFLKEVLPPLYLYPSALMLLLAGAVLPTLRRPESASAILGLICAVVTANAVLGFLLGGVIPGAALSIAAGIFGAAAWTARQPSDGR